MSPLGCGLPLVCFYFHWPHYTETMGPIFTEHVWGDGAWVKEGTITFPGRSIQPNAKLNLFT